MKQKEYLILKSLGTWERLIKMLLLMFNTFRGSSSLHIARISPGSVSDFQYGVVALKPVNFVHIYFCVLGCNVLLLLNYSVL